MYITNPTEIELKSFKIIEAKMKEHNFNEQELKIVKRTIHTTGDFDYQNIVLFKNDAVQIGIEAIKSGCRIVTDTQMAFSGINKSVLEKAGCTINNYIDREEVHAIAKEKGITRSMAAMDMAVKEGVDVFVIGNAPTALFRIGELINENAVSPKLIIGVPVGFVGAAESKEYIRNFNVPTITTVGTKGGSNVAAAIVNALLYMAVGR
jgi:precorrin-8X/cobalt-precorrin-8 methylmutase